MPETAPLPPLTHAGVQATRLTDTPDALGESPVWDAARGLLWWIDGVAGRIRSLDPASGATGAQVPGGHLGAIALARGGGLVLSRGHALLAFTPETGQLTPLAALAGADPAMRLNDGKADRQGRFLCAGMGRGGEALGALHQYDRGQLRTLATAPLRIGNGLCLSPDGATLYFADTPARLLFAADYDPATGRAGPPRRHVDTGALGSGIDGATVDAAGQIWAAFIHSAEIACLSPEGRLLHRQPAPTDLPSSLAFGGPARDRLFVTSIRDSGTGRAVSRHPAGGHLFVLDGLGATGLPETPVILPFQENSP